MKTPRPAAFFAALVMAAALPSAAHAAQFLPVAVEDAVSMPAGSYVWRDPGQGAALSIVVSIPDQRAYVYRGRDLVAISTVSTGRDGHETPTGTFPVLQKAVDHKSSLYDDAAMPFMQRLTWDGVAIHAGANPGFPASHGCVRVPIGFAKKLFGATRIGTRVAVIDESVDGAPVDLAPPAPIETAAETANANAVQLASFGGAR